MNNTLRKYGDMKDAIKNLKISTIHQRFKSIYEAILSYYLRCIKKRENKNLRVAKENEGEWMFSPKCAVCDSKNRDLSKSKKLMGYSVT